jgi:hypothetical protein
MIIVNLFKRYKIKVANPDVHQREIFVINDAKGRVLTLVHKMFADNDLRAGDQIILDIRIQVERS